MPRLRPGAPAALLTAAAIVLGGGLATAGTVGAAAPASAAASVPATPATLPSGIEDLARYVPADSCDALAKPGTIAFAEQLKSATGVGYTIPRNCGSDALSTSEHYDGRAVDWFTTIRDSTSKAKATAVINWLLATDAAGHQYANARRLGVMYIIWNNKIWGSYRASEGWREYSGCSALTSTAYDTTCHRNHVHFSLSWEGAHERTSWWTGAVARPEFGPCRVKDLNWAAPRSSANYGPCASYPKVSAPSGSSSLVQTLYGYSGMYLRLGSAGPAVATVQKAVGAGADGEFGPLTKAALGSWQERAGLKATGTTNVATWRALLRTGGVLPTSTPTTTTSTPRTTTSTPRTTTSTPRTTTSTPRTTTSTPRTTTSTPTPTVSAVKATRPGLTKDDEPDLLVRRRNNTLWLYPGTGTGRLGTPRRISRGWGKYSTFFSPGDFTGDGVADVIARRRDGTLVLRAGKGTGGVRPEVVIGRGWNAYGLLLSPGDFTGDGNADVIARDGAGQLHLFAGTGHGGLRKGVVIGRGWNMFDTVFSPGDFTGDGKADLLGRTPGGTLYLYAGNGRGTFAPPRRVVGTGWDWFARITGAGDLDGDGRDDLLALTASGRLYFYAGDGTGSFAAKARLVRTGMTGATFLTGVR